LYMVANAIYLYNGVGWSLVNEFTFYVSNHAICKPEI
jgi:hypothetical protein